MNRQGDFWELRVNGIREGGPLYKTWDQATTALSSQANRLFRDACRSGRLTPEIAAAVYSLEEEIARGRRTAPRPGIVFHVKNVAHYAVRRIPR